MLSMYNVIIYLVLTIILSYLENILNAIYTILIKTDSLLIVKHVL